MVGHMAPDPDDMRMMRLYDDGASIRETAAACGRAPKTVHRRLAAAGVPRRRPGWRVAARGGVSGPRPPRRRPSRPRMTPAVSPCMSSAPPTRSAATRWAGCSGGWARASGRAEPALTAAPACGRMCSPCTRRACRRGTSRPRLQRGSAAGIARELRRAGRTPHRRRPVPPPVDLAVSYARAGSLRALNETLRVGEDRLRSALQEAGVPAGSLRDVPPGLRAEVARLAAWVPGTSGSPR